MKKFIYYSLILGSMMTLASCVSDAPEITDNEGNSVTFTVQLPEISTRFANGSQITTLYYSIFNPKTDALLLTKSQKWNINENSSATITVDLIPNQEYTVVFFACNSSVLTELPSDKPVETGYAYNPNTGEFTVNYDLVEINNDKYDAFCKTVPGVTTKTTETKVQLVRPFAQLNIGTTNLNSEFLKAAGYQNFSTTLNIKPTNLANGMSFLKGTYSNTLTAGENGYAVSKTISLGVASNPTVPTTPTDTYPVSGYSYLDMMYLLVDPSSDTSGRAVLDAEFVVNVTSNNEETVMQTHPLPNLPTKPNFMTNIYGSLLTESMNFTVELTTDFGGTINMWDGNSVENVDLSKSVIDIETPAQFVGMLRQVTNLGNPSYDFGGKTINIKNSIDFGNHPLTGIGTTQIYNLNINGNGTTLYNLNINSTNQWVALFSRMVDCKVTNWNFDGANVVNSGTNKYCSVLTSLAEGCTLENLTFNNCKVSGKQKCAIALGYSTDTTIGNTLTNVIVKNSTVNSTGGQAGAICGYSQQKITFTNCSAIDCTINAGVKDNKFKTYGSGPFLGIISGTSGIATFTDCTLDGCQVNITGYTIPEGSAYNEEYISKVNNQLWGASDGGTVIINGETIDTTP